MPTTTRAFSVTPDRYENVSDGNANCMLIAGEAVRIHIGGSAPPPGGPDYMLASSSVLTVSNLDAETDLWVRAETAPTRVSVIRGPSAVTVTMR